MTTHALQIETKIDELKKRQSELEESSDGNNTLLETIADIGTSIEELQSQICGSCDGFGEVTAKYSKYNPNIIDLPLQDCPECRGVGIA